MASILVVEDEAHLAAASTSTSSSRATRWRCAATGARPWSASRGRPPPRFDLVILDVMLPGLDGFAVARRMREAGNFTPVLMLTAKSLPEDVVQGLEAGADDYLPKPFDLPVLLARVKGLLRRRDWARGRRAEPGERARRRGARWTSAPSRSGPGRTVVRLTLLEAMLLKLLVQNAGRVVSKGEILEKVWNVSPDTETRAVDNFIVRLRRYLEDDPRFPDAPAHRARRRLPARPWRRGQSTGLGEPGQELLRRHVHEAGELHADGEGLPVRLRLAMDDARLDVGGCGEALELAEHDRGPGVLGKRGAGLEGEASRGKVAHRHRHRLLEELVGHGHVRGRRAGQRGCWRRSAPWARSSAAHRGDEDDSSPSASGASKAA